MLLCSSLWPVPRDPKRSATISFLSCRLLWHRHDVTPWAQVCIWRRAHLHLARNKASSRFWDGELLDFWWHWREIWNVIFQFRLRTRCHAWRLGVAVPTLTAPRTLKFWFPGLRSNYRNSRGFILWRWDHRDHKNNLHSQSQAPYSNTIRLCVNKLWSVHQTEFTDIAIICMFLAHKNMDWGYQEWGRQNYNIPNTYNSCVRSSTCSTRGFETSNMV
jgi:hypothetical protein